MYTCSQTRSPSLLTILTCLERCMNAYHCCHLLWTITFLTGLEADVAKSNDAPKTTSRRCQKVKLSAAGKAAPAAAANKTNALQVSRIKGTESLSNKAKCCNFESSDQSTTFSHLTQAKGLKTSLPSYSIDVKLMPWRQKSSKNGVCSRWESTITEDWKDFRRPATWEVRCRGGSCSNWQRGWLCGAGGVGGGRGERKRKSTIKARHL